MKEEGGSIIILFKFTDCVITYKQTSSLLMWSLIIKNNTAIASELASYIYRPAFCLHCLASSPPKIHVHTSMHTHIYIYIYINAMFYTLLEWIKENYGPLMIPNAQTVILQRQIALHIYHRGLHNISKYIKIKVNTPLFVNTFDCIIYIIT